MYKKIKKGFFDFSIEELKDLLKAWLAISFIFAVLFHDGFAFSLKFLSLFLISGFTVGIGFIFHELGHKLMAQHYGCYARFKSFDFMLVVAILLSFLGFVFIAPGAVMISGPIGKKRSGIISLFGPLMNILLALIFLLLFFTSQFKFFSSIGFLINSWLALFNMLPFPIFDGRKILYWNKWIYALMVIVAVALLFLQNIFAINL